MIEIKLIFIRLLLVISTIILLPLAMISLIIEYIIRFIIALIYIPIVFIFTGNPKNLIVDFDESITSYIVRPLYKLNDYYCKIINNI